MNTFKIRSLILHRISQIIILTLLFSAPILKAEEEAGIANYAYSIFSGTGRYQINDRTIYVFRMPLVWDLSIADYEEGKIGYRFLLPVAIGVTDFDRTRDDGDFPEIHVDNLQSISVTPGIEMVIPVAPYWQVKPFAQAGYGSDLKSDDYTFIWGAGARTRFSFHEDSNWLIGGEFLHASNHPNGNVSSTSFDRWGLGTEYKVPTNWQPFGHRVSWHARLLQWYFTDATDFQAPPKLTKIRHSTEVGFSFGIDPPISILGYEFSQGGIGYEKADGYDAITLFTTFPF